jgi:hypothetical protein
MQGVPVVEAVLGGDEFERAGMADAIAMWPQAGPQAAGLIFQVRQVGSGVSSRMAVLLS